MEHVGGDIDRLALNLVGPAAIVPEAADDGTDVAAGQGDRLAIVERLDGSQQVEVLFAELRKLDQEDAALLGSHAAPRALESLACGGNGNVDILLGGLAHRADDLLGRRVDDLECLLVDTLDELVVDEAAQKALVWSRESGSNRLEGTKVTYSPVGWW